MSTPPAPPELDAATRRALAVGLYNHTWTLLETADRTVEQIDEMIHAAHASAYHWREVGDRVRHARGEWLCSRVYAVTGRAEPALHHAARCLAMLESAGASAGRSDGASAGDGVQDWDLAAAYEALARAHAVAGDAGGRSEWTARARIALAAVQDPEDRQVIEQDLETLGT